MAKAQKVETQETESVNSILAKIKNMVTGKEKVVVEDDMKIIDLPDEDEEPLELTEVVEGNVDASLPGEEMFANADTASDEDESTEFVDILKEIDNALVDQYEKDKVVEEAPVEAAPAEVAAIVVEEAPAEIPVAAAPEVISVIAAEPTQPEVKDILSEIDGTETIAQQPQAEEIISAPAEEAKKQFPEEISNNIVTNTPSTMTEKKENILSQDIADKSSKAIQNLLNNIPRTEIESPAFRSATTLEDIVTESLKPMLKQWLDANLETIVRDIVEHEIRKLMPRE